MSENSTKLQIYLNRTLVVGHFLTTFFFIKPFRYAKTIDFWQDVYGFKMSCMKESVLIEASVEVVPKVDFS